MKRRSHLRGRRAFTLIELLLAMAIMSMLLAALLTFVFSMTEIWGNSGEKRLFDQHVDAVTRHVESMLRRAALPAAGAAQSEPFTVREINTPANGKITGLGFTLTDGDRLATWGGTPAPFVECVLQVLPQQGLVLFWRSTLEEEEDDWRETDITPFVDRLTYDYYNADAGSWRDGTDISRGSDGKPRVPDVITLHFVHGKNDAERTIVLPVLAGGIPSF